MSRRVSGFSLFVAVPFCLGLGRCDVGADRQEAGSRPVQVEARIFEIVDDLVAHRPFRPDDVARITGRPLRPDARQSNPYFTIYVSGQDSQAIVREVELRVPATSEPAGDGLAILTVPAAHCIPPSSVMGRFGRDPEVRGSDPNDPTGFSYEYRRAWGDLRFTFSRGDPCLQAVVLDATEPAVKTSSPSEHAVAGGQGSGGESSKAPATTPPETSIGTATMTVDGTIILDLRAEGPGGMRGDARFVYPARAPAV